MDLRQAYKILEIPEGSTMLEAKEAYRDLAQIWHPDRHTQNERLQRRAAEKMKELNAAYDRIRLYFDAVKTASSADETSDSSTSSQTIVACPQCGTENRFRSSIDKSRVKCGRCRAYVFREAQNPEDESGYILCGDGACIGRIYDATGRCSQCGKTFAEGMAAERERNERRNQEQNRDTLRLRHKKKVTFGLVAAGVFIGFLLILTNSLSSPPAPKAPPSTSQARLAVPIESEPVSPNRLRTGANPFASGVRSGHSEITVENGTDTDAMVRVMRARADNHQNVRNFYIRANDQFIAKRIPPGEYALKVAFGKDWNSEIRRFNFRKSFSETQSFTVEETTWTENQEDGDVLRTRSSRLSITLHKVPHGNFRSHPIDEDEFWQ